MVNLLTRPISRLRGEVQRLSRVGAQWETVTTTCADLLPIKRFVAHHLRMGAAQVTLYLDTPAQDVINGLRNIPRVKVIICDENYWSSYPGGRPDTHQKRQEINATQAYEKSSNEWLAHIDIDEFLFARKRPLGMTLERAKPDCAIARFRPVEALTFADGVNWEAKYYYFKSRILEHEDPSVAKYLYPELGPSQPSGLLGHKIGKVIVRTGLPDPTFRIHGFDSCGERLPRRLDQHGVVLCHFYSFDLLDWLPPPTRESGNVSYNRAGKQQKKLYRRLRQDTGLKDHQLTELIRDFNTASPDLLRRLRKHRKLLKLRLDFNGSIEKVFGP
ncbi:glycosyltransferase family 2 protein [Halovulum sp. GXIMD14793]